MDVKHGPVVPLGPRMFPRIIPKPDVGTTAPRRQPRVDPPLIPAGGATDMT